MSFQDDVQGSGTSDYFKVKDGDNKLRILTEPVKKISRYNFGICYEGADYCESSQLKADEKLRVSFVSWVVNRATGQLQMYEMPLTIAKEVLRYMRDDEYGFSEFPMPYDINIKAEGAGTKEVEYSVTASRKNTPITDAEKEILSAKKSIADILDLQKQKAREKHGGAKPKTKAPAEDIDAPNPDDIPF